MSEGNLHYALSFCLFEPQTLPVQSLAIYKEFLCELLFLIPNC